MIEGSLRNVPLTDVVQVVSEGQKSGVLTVARHEVRARLYLEHGRVQVAHLDPGIHLGEVLVRMDLLTTFEVQEMLALQDSENAGTPLGLMAIDAGLLGPEQLQAALRRQAVEAIAELLSWREGTFSFAERSITSSQAPTEGAHDAMRLLMEADELRRELDEGMADPATIYRRVGDPTDHELPPGAWDLVGLVDGFRPARTIVADVDLGEGEALRLLRRLEELRVIEGVERDDPDPAVMVVCASAALQRLIRLSLQRVGLRPELFESPDAALAALDDVRPKVLVVDDRDGEGWRLLRQVRSTAGRRHLPAVVLTDDVGGGPLSRWRRPKAEVLARPFAEVELQQSVSRLAGRPVV